MGGRPGPRARSSRGVASAPSPPTVRYAPAGSVYATAGSRVLSPVTSEVYFQIFAFAVESYRLIRFLNGENCCFISLLVTTNNNKKNDIRKCVRIPGKIQSPLKVVSLVSFIVTYCTSRALSFAREISFTFPSEVTFFHSVFNNFLPWTLQLKNVELAT